MYNFKLICFSCLAIFAIILTPTFSQDGAGPRKGIRKRKLIQGFKENSGSDSENRRFKENSESDSENRRSNVRMKKKRPTESSYIDVPYEPEGNCQNVEQHLVENAV
jgi:hypothetical protein